MHSIPAHKSATAAQSVNHEAIPAGLAFTSGFHDANGWHWVYTPEQEDIEARQRAREWEDAFYRDEPSREG